MIPVYIQGTPIQYTIHDQKASLEKPCEYSPGNVFIHEILGKIRCEEFQLNEKGDIQKVLCSIQDKKKN